VVVIDARRAVTERGSASLLAAALSAVILLLGLMMVTVIGVVSAAVHASTAADAAALAAVSPVAESPEAAARGVAALNGARLVSCRCPVAPFTGPVSAHVVVETVVRVPFFGPIRIPAQSRAEFVPDW
jgi:secretion/DNA translocation related TadE-like protein